MSLIIDNTMIGIDILQYMYNKPSYDLAVKLDMVKAFDRVKWFYYI